MTLIKLILVSLVLVSCGQNVKFSENKLESTSFVTSKSFEQNGTLIKGNPSFVQTQGGSYPVSQYSSQASVEFIKALSDGAQVNILYTGGIDRNQIVLETVRTQ